MKRLDRDPLRFDVFELFTMFGVDLQEPLHSTEVREDFLSSMRASIDRALSNDALIHGQRTQAMFEGLVAELGAVKLLKQEDRLCLVK